MTSYVALATGNFATLATWGVVDTTSILDSQVGSQTVTTAYSGTRSQAFTPGAITLQGFCLHLRDRTGTTGTISAHIALSATNVEVAGTLVTLNCSQLPVASNSDDNGSWIYFEFAAPVTLAGATGYEIEVLTSSSSQVNLHRDGTGGNVSRLLVTTTNPGALGAGDVFTMSQRYQNTTTVVAVTVTMDNTATTSFGKVTVSNGATMTFGTTASTAYYLKMAGDLRIYQGGTVNVGTGGTPMPSSSSAVIEFDPAADGDFGLIVKSGGSLTTFGASKTPWRLLASDAAATATSMTVNSNVTNWKSGDSIVIASTTRTQTQSESKALSSDTTGTTTIPIAALTNTHNGGGGGPNSQDTSAEVINITRNVKIRSATATKACYITIRENATVSMNYTEIYYLGSNGQGVVSRGLVIYTTTGSCTVDSCSMHDFLYIGFYFPANAIANITITNNVCWHNAASPTGNGTSFIYWNPAGGSGVSCTITGNVGISNNSTSNADGMLFFMPMPATFGNNRSAGWNRYGIVLFESSTLIASQTVSWDSLVTHSNGYGIQLSGIFGTVTATVTNLTSWRNNNTGLILNSSQYGVGKYTITALLFGNAPNLIHQGWWMELTYLNCNFDGEASYTTTYGIQTNNSLGNGNARFINCNFGRYHTHTSADILMSASNNSGEFEFFNCYTSSSTPVLWSTRIGSPSALRFQRLNGGATTFRSFFHNGSINQETSTRHTASGYSWKCTPLDANDPLVLPGPSTFDTFKVACPANVARTITVWVYRDGSYNGSFNPTLVVIGGLIAGVGSDISVADAGGASGWNQISSGSFTPTEDCVIEFYVKGIGTAGNFFVDDVSVT